MMTPRKSPGVNATRTVNPRQLWRGAARFFPGAQQTINGALSRDPGNTGAIFEIRGGTLMGRVTATGLFAPAVIGTVSGTYNGGTTVTTSAASATELVRRVGASGNLVLTGPATAAGTVRQITVAYSSVNTGTGAITVTAANVNEVQTLNWQNSPTGTFRIGVVNPSGVLVHTQPITYNSTPATLVGNINTALDAALGAGLVVASGSAVTAIALTFSGAGYAATPQPALVTIDTDALTAGNVTVTRTTAGVNGSFVANSWIGATDGTSVPVTFIGDPAGIRVVDYDGNSFNEMFTPPIGGEVYSDALLPWPSDAAHRNWVFERLNEANRGGMFVGDHNW